MTGPVWHDGFSVGLPEIDRDHKILFDLIGQFHDAYAAGKAMEEVGAVFEILMGYIEGHFAREEAVFAACAYPGADRHVATHAWFTREVKAMYARFNASAEEGLCVELLAFLSNWWRFHVLEDDALYGVFIRENTG